jgi:hypothetical protein
MAIRYVYDDQGNLQAQDYDENAPEYMQGRNPELGLTAAKGITRGLRGEYGGENAQWSIDPKTGREVPVIGGYLLSDLMQKFGSMDAIRNYGANPNAYNSNPDNYDPYLGQGLFAKNLDIFGARPSNDTFSGKDGLKDLITIAAMAAPVIGGALGGAAATTSGAAGTAEYGGVASSGLAVGDAAAGGGSGVSSLSGPATGGYSSIPPNYAAMGASQPVGPASTVNLSTGATGTTAGSSAAYQGLTGVPSATPLMGGASPYLGVPDPSTTPDYPEPQPEGSGSFDPSQAGGGEVGSGYPASAPGDGDIWSQIGKLLDPGNLKGAKDALGLGGGLYSLYNATRMEQQLGDAIKQAQGAQAPTYDYSQNWDMVNQYMNDPMSLIKNNPGYLASVDYMTNQEARRSAGHGQTNSGNRVYNTANILGNNAQKWYNDMWNPIKDAAGLSRPDQSSSLLDTQTRALNQINTTKQNALGDVFKKGADTLPSLFKWLS